MTEIDNFWLGTALGAGANPKQFVSRSLLLRIPAQHAPHLWTLLRPSYELLYNTRILPQLESNVTLLPDRSPESHDKDLISPNMGSPVLANNGPSPGE
jgi:hypothetical protein